MLTVVIIANSFLYKYQEIRMPVKLEDRPIETVKEEV
jgi:hypothetical protein